MILDVQLYSVPRTVRGADLRGGVPQPTALPAMTVEARSYDKARVSLREVLEKQGFEVRSINLGQNKAGRTCLVAYVHGEEQA